MYSLKTTLKKGLLAVLTWIVGYLATNPQILVGLLPENITKMTVGAFVAFLIVSVANWLKHKCDKEVKE